MYERLVGRVPKDWSTTTLGELCKTGGGGIQTGPFGSQLHASDYVSSGIPVVMPQNIGDNVINERGIARVRPSDAARLDRHLLRAGDIVYSRRGDVERRALVRPIEDGWLCGTGCLRVRVGNAANPAFISYFLGHPEVRRWIVKHAVGATMPNLNTAILSSVPLILPPRHTQDGIAAVLGVIDDKIALNDRIAASARALGEALYNAYTQDQSSEHTLGEITALLARGIAPRYSEVESDLLILNQRCIRDGRVSLINARRTTRDKLRPDRLLRRHDVVVNSTGTGTLGRVAICNSDRECTVDTHVTIVRFDRSRVDPLCAAYGMLKLQPYIENLGEGSTGQTELSRSKLANLRVRLPTVEKMRSLRPVLEALEDISEHALDQAGNLQDLRNTLLPALMSGQIRVRDTER